MTPITHLLVGWTALEAAQRPRPGAGRSRRPGARPGRPGHPVRSWRIRAGPGRDQLFSGFSPRVGPRPACRAGDQCSGCEPGHEPRAGGTVRFHRRAPAFPLRHPRLARQGSGGHLGHRLLLAARGQSDVRVERSVGADRLAEHADHGRASRLDGRARGARRLHAAAAGEPKGRRAGRDAGQDNCRSPDPGRYIKPPAGVHRSASARRGRRSWQDCARPKSGW